MTLSKREKYLLSLAVGSILLLLTYHFMLKPAMTRRDNLQRVIPGKKEDLAEIYQLAGEYELLEKEIAQLSEEIPRPEADFSPLSFLESTLDEAGIASWSLSRTQEVRSERVMQVVIDIRIDETGWRELINFFQSLDEAEPSLRLSRFDIRKQRGRGQGLSANLTVMGVREPE